MRVSAVVFFLLAVVLAVAFAQFNIRHLQRDIILKEGVNTDSVLSLQRCKGSSTWTLHGVWPQFGQTCTKEKFDVKQVAPIRSELDKYWMSCPGYTDNVSFWTHEWEKHGTCAKIESKNATQLQYFTLGLQLRDEYHGLCRADLTGECRITLDKNYNVVRITEYEY
eukprot:UN00344